jgi:mutator protein MutT
VSSPGQLDLPDSAPASVINVAAGLVVHSGRLLISQRPSGSHLAGLWEFPGGKLEPGETWEDCLARELKEELGIHVQFIRWFSEVTHPYPGRWIRLRFGVCRWVSGQPQALGCAAFAWVLPGELAHFRFPPADMELLEQIPALDEFHDKSF